MAKVIAQTNWISDYSFEEQAEGEQVAVRAPWEVTSNVASGARIEAKSEGNLDGNKYFHWYSASENTWELSQTVTGVPSGTYDLAARMMAGDMKNNYKTFNLWYQVNDGERVEQSVLNSVLGYGSPLAKYMVRIAIENIVLTGENNTIKIGLYCEQGASAWGHVDVWSFSEHLEDDTPANYIQDGDFLNQSGSSLSSPWVLDSNEGGAFSVTANAEPNAIGSNSESISEAHWWSSSTFSFAFHQVIENLPAGSYKFRMVMNVGDASLFTKFEMYTKSGESAEVVHDFMSYCGWYQNGRILELDLSFTETANLTLGFRVAGGESCWGHFTDLSLLAA